MGPLVRILVQLSIAAMQVLGRSFAQAYAQAAASKFPLLWFAGCQHVIVNLRWRKSGTESCH